VRRIVKLSSRQGKLTKTGARALKAAIREGRKTTAFVRPHSRHVIIRARRMFLRTLEEEKPRISPRLIRALEILVKTGKAPILSQLSLGLP
jgi:hypothetical protein